MAASAEQLKHIEAQLADAQREGTRKAAALAEGKAYARRLEDELRSRDFALAEAACAAEALRRELEVSATALSDAHQAAQAEKAECQALAAALDNARQVGDAERAASQGYVRHVEHEFAKAATALRQAEGYARSLEAEFARTQESSSVQLNAILNSTSWRILSPLRAIIDFSLRRPTGAHPTIGSLNDGRIATTIGVEIGKEQFSQSASLDLNRGERLPGPAQEQHLRETDSKRRLSANAQANLQAFLASGDRIAFPSFQNPEISVIVVLWNQAHLTLRCLRALHQDIKARGKAEVILVDNASSDQTQDLLSRLDGVRTVRNAENMGFVRAVNQAAALAEGRLLLLLNSDAFIRPGALVAAQSTLDEAHDIGVVGGRIVLPSGLLQEAGSIIWSDGSTAGYGRGLSPDSGEVMFRREVDYVSGAFLMTPRSLWERLGGFDLSYSPGYYEDADYCMRAREIGCRVLYEPTAIVDHFENGSERKPGDAEAATLANRQRFRDRHQKALADDHSPYAVGSIAVLNARERIRRHKPRRLLVIDNEVPIETLGSGYPRMRKLIIEALGAGWSISLFPLNQPTVQWPAARAALPWEIEILSDRGAPALAEFLEERRGYYNLVLVSRPDNMALVHAILRERPSLLQDVRLIYDAEALFATRAIARAAFEGEPLTPEESERIVSNEVGLAEGADAIICVTDAEAEAFRKRHTMRVYVVSHPTKLRRTSPQFEDRVGFLFVGRLLEREAPNWRGLAWFIREVWPRIRARLPDASLVVVGHTHHNSSELHAPGVHLSGPVADLDPIYDAARVFVAPIHFAAGVPIKILEATAAGLPTIATRLMARQLSWIPGIEIAAEDEPSAFAAASLALHEDQALWDGMRQAAQKRVEYEHSVNRFRDRINEVLEGEVPLLN